MPVLRSLLPISFAPSEFGPLMPTGRLGALIDTTRRVFEKASKLKASASPETRDALRAIVRSMNSYYSNAIEGESTHPANIECALHQNFSSSPHVARRQRLALAHIDAATAGALPRGDFIRMTGLEERTARKLVSRFLQDGLLQSDGHRSELGIAFPPGSLNVLFPNLYPEAGTKHFE